MPPLLFVLHPQHDGWRWAVHHCWESQLNDNPLDRCVNAGWCPTLEQADAVGQLVLYSIMSWLRLAGLTTEVVALTRDVDIVAGLTVEAIQVSDNLLVMGVLQ